MRITGVTGIGWRALAVLREAGGAARVLAPLSASIYIDAAGEVLWIGARDAAPHARAIMITGSPRTIVAYGSSGVLRLALPLPPTLRPWRPADVPATPAAAAALMRGATQLGGAIATLGAPRGFGARLARAPLAFPLAAAAARAEALARACADDAPARAADAALALLGLGPGLTPAGDDFVGGAFFARALLARAGACDAARWREAADAVRAAAGRLTHPIAAALLGDLLAGEGWAPLHDLAAALMRDDRPGASDAARRLTRLGHSSGWDLLAGFVAGAAA